MTMPMRMPIQGHGVYRPGPAGTRNCRDIVEAVLDEEPGTELLREFVRGVEEMRVDDLSANKTGRRISVKARIFGRRIRFSIMPYQHSAGSYRPRTLGSITEELVSILSSKALKGSPSLGDHSVLESVYRLSRDGDHLSAGRAAIKDVITDRVHGRLMQAGSVVRLHAALTQFVSCGGHLKNFDAHQRGKAMEQFREMAVHALRHGSTLDELKQALDEEMVRATMEG